METRNRDLTSLLLPYDFTTLPMPHGPSHHTPISMKEYMDLSPKKTLETSTFEGQGRLEEEGKEERTNIHKMFRIYNFSIGYNTRAFEGWALQPAPCCGAASVAGALNTLFKYQYKILFAVYLSYFSKM